MCQACNPGLMRFIGSYCADPGRREALRKLGAGMLMAASQGFGRSTEATAAPVKQGPADTIFLSRNIYTMSERMPRAQAIAVRGGRIVAVGSRADLLGLKGRFTRIVDFGDMTVMPGFVDAHMHSCFCVMRPWLDVGPFVVADMDEARGRIAAAAKNMAPGQWLLCKMLDPSLTPGRTLSRTDLDALVPDLPVFVLESNGHVAYANSAAFLMAGIDRNTPDPAQGRYERDSTGELTGRIEETPAFAPILAKVPPATNEQIIEFLRQDFADASSKGCTALHDCGIGLLAAEGDLALIDATLKTEPGIRYAGLLISTHFRKWKEMGLRPGQISPRFSINGIKVWSDGSNQARTGYQRQPYLGTTDRGKLNYLPEEIENVIREAHEAGWQVGVHSNGDAAIDVTLDAFERATRRTGGNRRLRHRIEHSSILHDSQIDRMRNLGISPSFLIGHVHFWGRAFRDRILGLPRANRLDPCRSALRGGLRISLHSDYNVTPIDPLRCVQNAVLRDMREGGGVLNPGECITPMQALRAVTIDAAWQCHLDHVCGSLEPGKAADLVVLERDPIRVPADEIQSIEVHSTWLEGTMRTV